MTPRKRPALRFFAWTLVVVGVAAVAIGALSFLRKGGEGEDARRYVPREKGRSVLLITLDTTRPDRLEPYGADDVETPVLARLANGAVTFERAYAVAPITLVAHTSILSGLSPPVHGVRNNGIHYVPDEVETLAEMLGREGYDTGAFVSASVLEARYNLTQGFDTYDDDLSAGRERHPRMVADRPAEAVVDSALGWLEERDPDRPFFLWVHFYDPHAAYSPPPPYRDTYRERLYDGEIAYMDAQIGRLLAHPRLRRDVITTVMGDHGESLGEHGEQTHALLAYDSTLHIPFFLDIPGGPRGLRLKATVGQVDFVPTLLELLELKVPEGLSGTSLLPLLTGAPGAERLAGRSLYAETYLPFYTYGWARLRVLRQGRMKWIDAPTPELYDTERDPRELTNLAEREPGRAHDMQRDLTEYREAVGEADREATLALDAESRERLRSLGYLSVGSGQPEDEGRPRPDPKEVIDLHVGLERARFFSRDRLFEEAERELRQVLRRDPTNLAALTDLSAALADQGEVEEAIRVTERALDLDPAYVRLHLQLAGLEARRGELEKALEITEGALALDERSLEARVRRAFLLSRLERREEAETELEAAREMHPDSAQLAAAFAQLVDIPGRRLEKAEERLRFALERDPFLAGAWRLLGEVQELTGRGEEAVESYARGLERDPEDADLHGRLGAAYARGREARKAELHLREALRLSPEPRLDLRVSLGGVLAEQGRFEQAQAEYAKVLAEQPDHPGARNNRAIALYQRGDLAGARDELTALVAAHPRHADAHNNLAAVTLDQEDFEAAARHARRALALRPRMAEAWNNLGLALSGQAGGGQAGGGRGKAEEAARAYRRALELQEDYWQARFNLGILLADRGDPREAADALEEAIRTYPRFPDAYLALGRLYAGALNDPERARKHLNAFLRRAPDHPEAAAVRAELAGLG